ncbi:MAG: hypothetical protein RIT28_1146, partial [Pseudomonadota bacterium]
MMEVMAAGLACIMAFVALVLPIVAGLAAFSLRRRVAALELSVELLEGDVSKLKERLRAGAVVPAAAPLADRAPAPVVKGPEIVKAPVEAPKVEEPKVEEPKVE